MPTNNSGPNTPSIVDETLRATKRLADQRASVNAQAERLNKCIEQFESWIASIPGRVETTVVLPDLDSTFEATDALDVALVVRVSRDGQRWPVSWSRCMVDDDQPINFRPLREASIEIKLHVIPNLPRLIVEMATQQEKLKSRIDVVATGFEAFANQVGMTKEGK